MSAERPGRNKTGAVAINPNQDAGREVPAPIDPNQPNAARVYDWVLGGTANFPADRRAAEKAAAAYPGGMDALRATARANRDFIGRAVTYLAGEAGIRQFLDLGTGIPTNDNVHAVAQRVAPDARIVCADYDPGVLAHAHDLMRSTPQGAATFLRGDFRDVEHVLERAAGTLDFTKPVAVMLVALLHFFPDDEHPWEMVARYMAAVPNGSYLAISHATSDFRDLDGAARSLRTTMAEPVIVRDRAQVLRFLDGLQLVEPGLVGVNHWRNDPGKDSPVGYYAAVARKAALPGTG